MFAYFKPKPVLNQLTVFLFCILFMTSCDPGDKDLDKLEPKPEVPGIEVSTKLTLSTTHATGESMELYYVVFNENGAVVIDEQSKKSIRRAAAINLKGKTYDIGVGVLTKGSTVSVLGFASQTEGDMPTINEGISKITEPIVVAKEGSSLEGDFFYGKYNVTTIPAVTGEVKLERISGQVTLRLAGDEALVKSVLRVEFNFNGAPFYNGITASGALLKVAEGYTGISQLNFAQQPSSYMLPSLVVTGNSGTGRIYYGQSKVKEFSWGADAALRIEANQQTTITLKLSSSKTEPEPPIDPENPEPPIDPENPDPPIDPGIPDPPIDPGIPDPEQITISLTGSQSLVDGSSDAIDNGITGKGYYTYKLLGTLSKANFIPGAMVLDGEWLYVGNNKSIQEGTAALGYSVEAFNIETMLHMGTLPRYWTITAHKEQFVGIPRALALSDGRLYAAYSQAPFTRVVVYDLVSGEVETCIGTGVAAAARNDNKRDIDEPMSIYADNQYIYLIDSYREMRIYNQSDITQAKYNEITPYAKSVIKNVGKPHIVGMFRSPEGTLYRTGYDSHTLLAIDPSKIVAGDNLDIMNPTLNIDLSGAMFDDTSIIGLLSTMIPYGVAYHHGNMFAVVNSEDNSSQREGYLSEYSADGKTFIRSLRYLDGYTVKRPVAIIISGDKMIISDQLNKDIAIIQITYHPTVHYE